MLDESTPLVRSGRNLDSQVAPARASKPDKTEDQGAIGLLTGIGEKSLTTQPEIETIRSQWKTSLQELENEKQARAADAARLAARVEALEWQLSVVAKQAGVAGAGASKKRTLWPLWVAFTAASCIVIGLMVVGNLPVPQRITVEPVPAARKALKFGELPDDPYAALNTGIDQLNTAVASVGDRSPEESLRLASRPGHSCRLVWTDRLPSVVFGMEPIRQNSLAHTLADCAREVSKVPNRLLKK